MNNVEHDFYTSVYRALQHGREKKNNIFLVGPTNCAKSFCLKPLRLIFRAYSIPDEGSHQLETILDKEVMFLNDFEWSQSMESWMRWSFFKNFLEGEPVEVAVPKTRGTNVMFEKKIPVFGSCPKRIELTFRDRRHGVVVHESESAQMDSRVHYIPFTAQIATPIKCQPCAHCGARLYLRGKPDDSHTAASSSGSRSRSPHRGMQ
eukprot:2897864-Karenia_brevis.AAC.1